jgi:hypothetical protein
MVWLQQNCNAPIIAGFENYIAVWAHQVFCKSILLLNSLPNKLLLPVALAP